MADATHPATRSTAHAQTLEAKPISEDELRRKYEGKTFYLRGGYIDNELRFDQYGRYLGNSPQVSFTLGMVDINKVHVCKRKVEFDGIRYAIHFLGASPSEDPMTASDRVRITPRKKVLRIMVARADVLKPKKEKKPRSSKQGLSGPAPETAPTLIEEQGSGVSQAAANQRLDEALGRVLAQGIDERLIASLPDYWQLYYRAAAVKSDFKPADASVLRQNTVDRKARLVSMAQPESNEYAQKAGVAGLALYHVVVGADGKPGEIAVGRPIGFGLDENAVASIRKAQFQPAMKDGKTVPVLVDLLVQFRIYSKRTGAPAPEEAAGATVSEPEAAPLPGPYTANQSPARQP